MVKFIKECYRFLSPRFQNLFLEYRVTFKPRYGHGLPPHELLNKIIGKNREFYFFYLKKTLEYKSYLFNINPRPDDSKPYLPHWNNDFLPGLDIISLYTMVAYHQPSKYIEVGSGNSTKVVFKAKSDLNLSTEIISIDPHPRAEIDQLANKIIRKPFEEADYNEIFALKENDILFIDNSHRILPDSDSMVFFMEVLPRLNKGVIVQIHDIYLPYDYPQFMCDRAYNEQYGLACYFLANPDFFQILMPNYYISEDTELSSVLLPFWENQHLKNVEKHGGSFWFRVGINPIIG
jgi:hypothetical protein